MHPLISIIIPIYNAELYIARCIDSILNQGDFNFELLLINDGSSDGSDDICKKYSLVDSRIKYFIQENGGVSSARNLGLSNAKGEWIMFVDSDDWLELNTLEVSMPYLCGKNDLVVFGMHEDWGREPTAISKSYNFSGINDLRNLLIFLDQKELLQGPVCKYFRSSILKEYNIIFDTSLNYGEDSKFTFSYLSNCKNVEFINQVFYHYFRRKEDNLSFRKYNYEQWLSINQMLFSLRMKIHNKFELGISYRHHIMTVFWVHYTKAILSMYDSKTKKNRKFRYDSIRKIHNVSLLKTYIPNQLFYKLVWRLSWAPFFCDLFIKGYYNFKMYR